MRHTCLLSRGFRDRSDELSPLKFLFSDGQADSWSLFYRGNGRMYLEIV